MEETLFWKDESDLPNDLVDKAVVINDRRFLPNAARPKRQVQSEGAPHRRSM